MTRVAIIGGGPGGLMTAHLLEQKCSCRATLFEASDRLGGKVRTCRFDSAPVKYEAGVAECYDYEAIGDDPLRNLMRELGLDTTPTGSNAIVLDGALMLDDIEIGQRCGDRTLRAIEDFRRQASTILPLSKWYQGLEQGDNGHPWARRTFEEMLNEVADPVAKAYLKVAVHSDLATEPNLTNGLNGLRKLLGSVPGYGAQYSIDGGMDMLPRRLAEHLTSTDVVLNAPVVRVSGHESSATGATGGKHLAMATSFRSGRAETLCGTTSMQWSSRCRIRGCTRSNGPACGCDARWPSTWHTTTGRATICGSRSSSTSRSGAAASPVRGSCSMPSAAAASTTKAPGTMPADTACSAGSWRAPTRWRSVTPTMRRSSGARSSRCQMTSTAKPATASSKAKCTDGPERSVLSRADSRCATCAQRISPNRRSTGASFSSATISSIARSTACCGQQPLRPTCWRVGCSALPRRSVQLLSLRTRHIVPQGAPKGAIQWQANRSHQRNRVAARYRPRLHAIVEPDVVAFEPVLEMHVDRARRQLVGDGGQRQVVGRNQPDRAAIQESFATLRPHRRAGRESWCRETTRREEKAAVTGRREIGELTYPRDLGVETRPSLLQRILDAKGGANRQR